MKRVLQNLDDELNQPSIISIQQDSSSFISKISVNTTLNKCTYYIPAKATWNQNGVTIAGGRFEEKELNQLSSPLGLYIDDDDTVYVADYGKDRVVQWKKDAKHGCVVAGGDNQLHEPINVIYDKNKNFLVITDLGNRRVVRWSCENNTCKSIVASNLDCSGLAIDNEGHIYVSDFHRDEVKRYEIGETNGTVVAGENGGGSGLNQLNGPRYICVDDDQSVYVSDNDNDRVVKWTKNAKQGIVVAGGSGKGNSLEQLSDPRGVIVDQLGTLYVADSNNNQVMRWSKGAKQGDIIIGGNGGGSRSNQLKNPMSLAFDRQGNLYVADCGNGRIQKYYINPIN